MIVRNRKSFLEPALVNQNGEVLVRCSREHLLNLCQSLSPRDVSVLLCAKQWRDDAAHMWFENRPEVRAIFGIEESGC